MELGDIKRIVDQWLATGQLSEADAIALKGIYLADIGAAPNCTTCPAFWSDVQHHFRYLLKTQNLTKMNSKYMVTGPFRPFGFSAQLVNGKGDGVNTLQITDELAEQLLADEPAYAESIVLNPAYEAPAEPEKKS